MNSFQSFSSLARTGAFALTVVFISITARAWKLEVVTGEVNIESHAADASAPVIHSASVGDQISEGDAVVTGAGALTLLTDGKSEVRLAGTSRLKVEQIYGTDDKNPGLISLQRGTLRANLKKSATGAIAPYEIKAKDIVAASRGADFFVEIAGGSVRVFTVSGEVTVRSKSGSVEVPAANTVSNNGGVSGAVRAAAPERLAALMTETKIDGRDNVTPTPKPARKKSKKNKTVNL